ncbi:hypothetical protein WEI85_42595 [Actinomycetes bacterium KLBMP 9797]
MSARMLGDAEFTTTRRVGGAERVMTQRIVPLVRRAAGKGAPISHRNLKELLESGRSP